MLKGKMGNKYKIFLIAIAIIITGLLIFISLKKKSIDSGYLIRDTNIVKRYESEVRHDTVFRFIDRIAGRKSKPAKVYIQRTDTVFIKEISKYDLPLRIEKSGENLNVKAVNINDSTLKEYVFDDIGNDFKLTPLRDNIIVRSSNFYYCRPDISFRILYPGRDISSGYEIFSETGISYRNKIFVSAGCGFEIDKSKFCLSLSLKLKLW